MARSKAAAGEIDESCDLLRRAMKKDSKTIKNWARAERIFQSVNDERINKIIR
ncbi:hypothetical protein QVH35_10180 [Candidatus Nitrosotenuis chungbukensis]|nr:hypothetical protein [Candidatus Nitrosotenuis chungbukensis]WKT57681.1 hypothetical protein QVH35_10180 [Candidatus Nitrosotenuis chungbukensis]